MRKNFWGGARVWDGHSHLPTPLPSGTQAYPSRPVGAWIPHRPTHPGPSVPGSTRLRHSTLAPTIYKSCMDPPLPGGSEPPALPARGCGGSLGQEAAAVKTLECSLDIIVLWCKLWHYRVFSHRNSCRNYCYTGCTKRAVATIVPATRIA